MGKNNIDITANEFSNFLDIKNNILYTKDNKIFGYLRIYPSNMELNTKAENEALTSILVANFKGDNQNMSYISLPREVDNDKQKLFLENKYMQEIDNIKKKQILSIMLKHAIELSSNHENYEHQIFLKVWMDVKDSNADLYLEEQELKRRLYYYQQFYTAVKIKTQILDDVEILKICNLFNNGIQATNEYIQDIRYTEHTTLR